MSSRKIIITILIWGFLFALPTVHTPAEERETLRFDLPACLDYALENHPSLKAAKAKRLLAWSLVEAGRAKFRPSLGLDVETGYVFGEATGPFALARGVTVNKIDPAQPYISGSLNLNYPLYAEGVLLGRKAPSLLGLQGRAEREDSQKEIVTEEIIYEVSAAFFSVMKHQALVSAAEKIYLSRKVIYEQATRRYEKELISRLDLLNLEVELASSEKEIKDAQTTLSLSMAGLAMEMGLDPLTKVEVVDIGYEEMSLPPMKTVIEFSYERRPELAEQEAKMKSAQAGLDLIRSERLPSVDFLSGYNVGDDFDLPTNSSWIAGLKLEMPLLDFGGVRSRISGARARVAEQEELWIQLKNSIGYEVIEAYTAILDAEARSAMAEVSIKQAEEAARLARSRHKSEMGLESEVFEAEAILFAETKRLFEAQFDRRIGVASLRKTVGGEL